ncbi:MAG: hypothetical protein WC121_11770 [Candidatus Kapaibacterium sp.]|jgi:hypothetical protein
MTFLITQAGAEIEKGDDEALDYGISYVDLLAADESIVSSDWTVAAGLTGGAEAVLSPVAVKWLSGGSAGRAYWVDNVATTSAGRTFERSFLVRVVARRWR